MSNIKKPLIVILGPTASGKTELAIKLAKKFSGEIVSADSRQIYKGMDIGTNKALCDTCHCEEFAISPLAKSRRRSNPADICRVSGIPHHLIDIIEPSQDFTLSDYKKMAIEKIKDIQQRGKTPFLVGGTGLYIQAVVDNLEIPQVKADKKLREELEKMGLAELLNLLKKLDPETAKTIDIYNKRRLVRAIEVCKLTGKPFSKQRKKGKTLFNVLQIGIKIDKKTLDQRINQRIEKMFKAGLVNEVKNLLKRYPADLPALSGIGYQEIITYLLCHSPIKSGNPENKITLEQTKDLIKLHTRQYAKRQITWFKRDKRIKWVEHYKEAKKIVREFI